MTMFGLFTGIERDLVAEWPKESLVAARVKGKQMSMLKQPRHNNVDDRSHPAYVIVFAVALAYAQSLFATEQPENAMQPLAADHGCTLCTGVGPASQASPPRAGAPSVIEYFDFKSKPRAVLRSVGVQEHTPVCAASGTMAVLRRCCWYGWQTEGMSGARRKM